MYLHHQSLFRLHASLHTNIVQDKKCEKILLPQRTIFFLHALLKFYTCCRSFSIIELHLSPLRKNCVFKLLTNNTVQYCTLYCICMQLCIFAMSKCAPSWNACTHIFANLTTAVMCGQREDNHTFLTRIIYCICHGGRGAAEGYSKRGKR
jgi:hypothetical protein